MLQGGDGKWSLVGVTANGYMGNKPGYTPDIFMRVTYFSEWIQETCKGSGPILVNIDTVIIMFTFYNLVPFRLLNFNLYSY